MLSSPIHSFIVIMQISLCKENHVKLRRKTGGRNLKKGIVRETLQFITIKVARNAGGRERNKKSERTKDVHENTGIRKQEKKINKNCIPSKLPSRSLAGVCKHGKKFSVLSQGASKVPAINHMCDLL